MSSSKQGLFSQAQLVLGFIPFRKRVQVISRLSDIEHELILLTRHDKVLIMRQGRVAESSSRVFAKTNWHVPW